MAESTLDPAGRLANTRVSETPTGGDRESRACVARCSLQGDLPPDLDVPAAPAGLGEGIVESSSFGNPLSELLEVGCARRSERRRGAVARVGVLLRVVDARRELTQRLEGDRSKPLSRPVPRSGTALRAPAAKPFEEIQHAVLDHVGHLLLGDPDARGAGVLQGVALDRTDPGAGDLDELDDGLGFVAENSGDELGQWMGCHSTR